MRRGDAVWPRPALPYLAPLVARGQALIRVICSNTASPAPSVGIARCRTGSGLRPTRVGSLQFVHGGHFPCAM